jgi:hypothetical protein
MEQFQKLKKWLKMENDSLRMYNRPIRGIYSTKDIKNGSHILKIPSKYLIEKSRTQNKTLEKKLKNSNSDMAGHLFLESQKKNSFYKPYLDSMPTDLSDYLFFYKKDDLDLLKKTSLFSKSNYTFSEQYNDIKHDAKIVYDYLKKKNKIHMPFCKFFPIFLKFRILVCSRIFGYNKNKSSESGLVPYADLFNHSNDSNTKLYFDDSKDSFILEATKDIPKKKEIFDSYGDKSNVQLLRYYSFTLPKNENSTLNIQHKNEDYSLDRASVIDDKSLKKKLQDKMVVMKDLLKKKKTKNRNVINIFNDEISISKSVLKNSK